MAPLVAIARRCSRPMDEIGNEIAAIVRRGCGEQFSARATMDGDSITPWPAPKPFGNVPRHPAMELSGDLRAAWEGGAGSFTEIRPRGVFIGVRTPHYVATFQRSAPSKVPPIKPAQRAAVGQKYGVWFTGATMAAGFEIAPRRIGVSTKTAQEVADSVVVAIAGEEGEVEA